jgi:hypothetical protein
MRIEQTLYQLATQRLFEGPDDTLSSARRRPPRPRQRPPAEASLLVVAALPAAPKRPD